MCEPLFAQVLVEDDGFKWEKFIGTSGGEGAKDDNGIIIIPDRQSQYIRYEKAKYGASVSVGYFKVQQVGYPSGIFITDIKGAPLTKASKWLKWLSIKVCDGDTLAYIVTSAPYSNEWAYYDLSGKRLIKTKRNVEVGDDGYLYDFDTKKSLGKKIPSTNGLRARFHIPSPSETIQTPLGEFLAIIKNDDDFKWKLLTRSDGKICGALDMNDNTIVPVADKAFEIRYINGLFECRQEGKDGLSFIYDTKGRPVISTLDGNNSLFRWAKDYFVGTSHIPDSDKGKTQSLYNSKGELLFPSGRFKYITVNHIGCPVHFYAKGLDGFAYVFDENLSQELKIPQERIEHIEKQTDEMGTYYILRMLDNTKSLMSANGKTIIPSGKYNSIKRIICGNHSFYEVYTRKRDYMDPQYGIVALNGKEVVAPEYDFIYYYGEEVEAHKGNEHLKVTADLCVPEPFSIKESNGLYYLENSQGVTLNDIGYNSIEYDSDRFSYIASIGKYTTFINPSGTEERPILSQMFNHAYRQITSNPTQARKEFESVISLDKNISSPSIISQCYNNIGCILFEQNNEDEALLYFQRALDIQPSNQIAANNLNEIQNPSVEVSDDNTGLDGWQIATNIFGILGNAVDSYNSASQSVAGNQTTQIHSNRRASGRHRGTSTKAGQSVSQSQNERSARNTYNNYVSQLIDMNTFRERYSDSQRRNIQSNMKSIRSRYNFPKSDWEDWTGSPR